MAHPRSPTQDGGEGDGYHHQLAWGLWLEAAAGEAWTRLAAAGVPAILLKGPAIKRWLYRDDEPRLSRDVDLLVAPDNFDRAQGALAALGYETRLAGAPACEIGPNSMLLFGTNDVCIDLHRHLIGAGGAEGRCWEVLSRHTVSFALVTGTSVDILDIPARAMHLALHAAQSGTADTKALADLERGLDQLGDDDWRAAAAVADAMRATPAFVAGLMLCPPGAPLAERLALHPDNTVELELRTMGARPESLFFVRLAEVPGAGAKLSVVGRKLWPTRAFMHTNYPLATRRWPGLLAARLWRPVLLVAHGAPALLTWLQARSRVVHSRRRA
ncbi:MAG: hypothetical protein QOK39_780 [Acidimicrobiaceae bacterium]|nr:hypothetical protein [Acidimicrobiaceae bacterium]